MAVLDGIKVLDLSRFIAGPLCSMLLGDMGADVVKIERPEGGEDARKAAPMVGGESIYVMMYNRNKRGLTLDMREIEGRKILRALIAEADVLVENFRPGTMEQMGLGWEQVQAINPRLVMVRISGFGQTGPYAQRPCFDVIAQAMSGLMEMTGEAGRPPLPSGTFLVDQVTGLYATIGTMAALSARGSTGRGQLVDVALLDAASTLLLTAIPEWLLLNKETSRNGSVDRYSAPAMNYLCGDGRWVHLNAGTNILFARLAQAMGDPGLASDPRFATAANRVANRKDIEAIVASWASTQTADDLVEAMTRAEVPCAKVASIREVAENPQLRHRHQIVEIDHPTIGKLPMPGLPVRLSETPGEIRLPPPAVGQHKRLVIKEWLGLSDAEIDALEAANII